MSNPQENEYRNLNFHPYNIMMILLLTGLTMLFLALSASYVYSRVQHKIPPIEIPIMFLFNTLILMGSSYTLALAKKNYENDDTRGYQVNLGLTLLLSILFMLAQCVAWWQMMQINHGISSSNVASYIWAISNFNSPCKTR